MSRLITTFTVGLVMVGCSYDTTVKTFGDGTAKIAEAFCEAREACELLDVPVFECTDLNVESLCTTRYDCDKELTNEQWSLFEQCATEFKSWNCSYFLPHVCYEVLELR